MVYDLAERTKKFALNSIAIIRRISPRIYNDNILKQLIRSSTSIGANYQEANGAVSRSEFRVKIGICKKEAMESTYWLELLTEIEDSFKNELSLLKKESHELILIFSHILKSSSSSK